LRPKVQIYAHTETNKIINLITIFEFIQGLNLIAHAAISL